MSESLAADRRIIKVYLGCSPLEKLKVRTVLAIIVRAPIPNSNLISVLLDDSVLNFLSSHGMVDSKIGSHVFLLQEFAG